MNHKKVCVIAVIVMLALLSYGCNSKNNNAQVITSPQVTPSPQVSPSLEPSCEASNPIPEDDFTENETVLKTCYDYGNLVNGGYAAYDGQYIYYVNGVDVVGDNKLYRVNTDWTEKTLITDDDKPQYINIVGDWIYYSIGSRRIDSEKGRLYKIKTDGTQRTRLNDDESEYVFVQGEWIYYANRSDGEWDSNYKLYKIKTDGTSRQKINDDMSSNILVEDDWIFYLSEKLDDGLYRKYLYKVKTDGSEKTQLCDDEMYHFILIDGWIYYTSGADEKLYKIDLNGNNGSIVINDQVGSFNTDGTWIYYSNVSANGRLYQIRLDGSEKQKIYNDWADGIHIVGDWIYYAKLFAEYNEPHRIKLDGTMETAIEEWVIEENYIFEEYTVFRDQIMQQFPYIEDVHMCNFSFSTSLTTFTSDPLSPEETIDVFKFYLDFITQEPVICQILGDQPYIDFDCDVTDANMYYARFRAERKAVYENKEQMGQDIEFAFVDEHEASDQFGIWSLWYDTGESD